MTEDDVNELRRILLAEEERLCASGRGGLALAASRERISGDEADISASEEQFATAMRLKDREKFLLEKVRKALRRLEAGEINECEGCGEEIGMKRLRARPVTTQCIDCKESAERKERATTSGTSPDAETLRW